MCKLQKVQNYAARLITNATVDQPAEPILRSLHWLPVPARIQFKVLVLVFKCLHGTAPVYLTRLINRRSSSSYSLRSDCGNNLVVPKTRTQMADRSFRVAGPKWWNALPNNIKSITN